MWRGYIRLFLLIAIAMAIFGCVAVRKELITKQPEIQPSQAQVRVETPEDKAAKIASLKVGLSKTTFSRGEPIKVSFKFRANRFDLNVESSSLSAEGMLLHTTIKTSTGDLVPPKKTVKPASSVETVILGNSSFEIAPGVKLKAGEEVEASVENLLDYYDLKPGTYTLQATLKLNVYRSTYIKKSPRLLEIENEITALRRDRKLDPDAKRLAIQRLREEIEFLKSRDKDLEKLYVRLDSLMGRTPPIRSNVVSFTISE
jgi:hypothetical protein